MAKSKSAHTPDNQGSTNQESKGGQPKTTLADLQENLDLWYKIQVLLHDLCNIANDRAAEARTLCTTDELYISGPYFTSEEAILIKATEVLPPSLNERPEFEAIVIDEDATTDTEESLKEPSLEAGKVTIEEAIKSCLQNFFDKRRASGDARPCGPHDMGPIYKAIFGITTGDLKNYEFLGRLRRDGLGSHGDTQSASSSGKQKRKGGKKI